MKNKSSKAVTDANQKFNTEFASESNGVNSAASANAQARANKVSSKLNKSSEEL